jgi:hypothetical protein
MENEISTFWSVIVEIGFIGWLGCAVGFIFRAIDDQNRLNKRSAAIWGSLIVLFYALWVLGLVKA